MNWDVVAAVAESLGAIAVILSLIYLSLQVRQGTNATRALIHQSRSEQTQEFYLFAAGSREFAEILDKIYVDLLPSAEKLKDLSSVERRRLFFYYIAAMQRVENTYVQYKRGYLNADTYDRSLAPVKIMIPIWEAMGMMNDSADEFQQELMRVRDTDL